MSSGKILEQAIRKAIDGGWTAPEFVVISTRWTTKGKNLENFERIILNHDFAKALWGDKEVLATYDMGTYSVDLHHDDGYEMWAHYIPAWQAHLQQMVIADDPIFYLGEHLEAGDE